MLDFTSSLYLGMTHASGSLAPWSSLTTGKPAVMASAPCTARVEHQLAALQGCERATLGTSTLHVVWDLFGMLASEDTSVHVDAGTYAVARWGVERARGRGAAVRTFSHHDGADLRRSIARLGAWSRPVVATDGFCPSCGEFAPLAEYLQAVHAKGGLLVVDDTQALGVFGTPSPDAPYGSEGGGSLQR
ncbi:MAG TPA: hypothetical protein VK841_24395, partial [Polyangiaceae bacterium]|nr:hypothetical protein [Polyangiaceae bacterium]